ncbi:MAG: ATP synthase epsilon chain [Parcubacteria group bacterium GW2011_GWA1_47_8]|uniref:ATP synthase epsilon chain n=1 Tax=Candidatus Gottesmanbacteria bacterium GW2011_GWA2_42_18 TaxID=1618442 RepID=A0A0G1BIW6_9BACT|nr:MAG: ATP synthase epsilon chain [Candidatus Gottesmanbacteria bacterium GW2011_GWA2_42_18]KKU81586.1 MAG: ATP synthase epsilon chain [Parcubacteria group bacterium GW2011_GWA1_47_8]
MNEPLSVKITNTERIIWEGTAEAVSSENKDGPFDILPEHANFLTLVSNKPIMIHHAKGSQEFLFKQAIVYVFSDKVSVYVEE